jgi:hypothetical protein
VAEKKGCCERIDLKKKVRELGSLCGTCFLLLLLTFETERRQRKEGVGVSVEGEEEGRKRNRVSQEGQRLAREWKDLQPFLLLHPNPSDVLLLYPSDDWDVAVFSS